MSKVVLVSREEAYDAYSRLIAPHSSLMDGARLSQHSIFSVVTEPFENLDKQKGGDVIVVAGFVNDPNAVKIIKDSARSGLPVLVLGYPEKINPDQLLEFEGMDNVYWTKEAPTGPTLREHIAQASIRPEGHRLG